MAKVFPDTLSVPSALVFLHRIVGRPEMDKRKQTHPQMTPIDVD